MLPFDYSAEIFDIFIPAKSADQIEDQKLIKKKKIKKFSTLSDKKLHSLTMKHEIPILTDSIEYTLQ